MTSYDYNNEGAGAFFLTMDNDVTANKDFKQADVDAKKGACAIGPSHNEVGMGTDGDRCFGVVTAVSEELDASGIPIHVTVQTRGVARVFYVATTPVLGQEVELDGAGGVSLSTAEASYPAGGHTGGPVVIAIDTTNTLCDIWLG